MEASLATSAAAATLRRLLRGQHLAALVIVCGAVALAIVMAGIDPRLAPLWLFGMAAGFTLQRSRFCFASAFRDLFLFGSARVMKGILLGLAIATVGFAVIMFDEVPFPAFGGLPQEAHILPVGLSTVIGGLLFGCGMVVAGGCSSGSLYRAAEGYAASVVAVLGLVTGFALLAFQWNWWWDALLSREPRLWLPAIPGLGYGGGVALTLAALLLTLLFLLWWEARNGVATQPAPVAPAPSTFGERLASLWRRVFVAGWSPVVGGAVLGGLVVLMYVVHMPWSVTGELNRWATGTLAAAGVSPGELRGLSAIGGCAARLAESGIFTHTFALTVGLFAGALVAALLAGEFKPRFPRRKRRYLQGLGGGVIMGYGAGLAIGCTSGAFFSAIPSLSASGWLFALALAGGAYLGIQVISRID